MFYNKLLYNFRLTAGLIILSKKFRSLKQSSGNTKIRWAKWEKDQLKTLSNRKLWESSSKRRCMPYVYFLWLFYSLKHILLQSAQSVIFAAGLDNCRFWCPPIIYLSSNFLVFHGSSLWVPGLWDLKVGTWRKDIDR